MQPENRVMLATEKNRDQWFKEVGTAPPTYRGGGRCGSIYGCTLEQFADLVGEPHSAAPRKYWRQYESEFIGGDGKVSAEWHFLTPRGLVEVSDYWWNQPDELSVRATDRRAMRWFKRWCKTKGLEFHYGRPDRV